MAQKYYPELVGDPTVLAWDGSNDMFMQIRIFISGKMILLDFLQGRKYGKNGEKWKSWKMG